LDRSVENVAVFVVGKLVNALLKLVREAFRALEILLPTTVAAGAEGLETTV